MWKSLLMLLLLPLVAQAAPFLRMTTPYPFEVGVPQSAYTFTATANPGPFSLPCTVVASMPQCDAAPALAVGVPLVTFIMRVDRVAGCDAIGANCWTAGAGVSAPFERRTTDLPVAAPTGLVLGP